MSAEQQDHIDLLSLRSIDSLPIRDTSADLISYERVQTHLARAIERRRYDGSNDPEAYLLAKRCLIRDNGTLLPTPAGILCFGRDPQHVFPHAVVNITHYRGTTPDSRDALHIEYNVGGTIFDQLDRIEDYLRKNTHHGMTVGSDSFERVEIDEYPRIVLREISVNMLAHRDYQDIHGASRVQLFANHIEWMNPGGLPDGVTIDNILVSQRSRNPIIFSILREGGYIEGVGQGLDTVVAVLAREQMAPPHFEDIDSAFFIAKVTGRPLESFYDSDVYGQLSSRQRRILGIVRGRTEVSTSDITASLGQEVAQRTIQRDIRALLKLQLITAVGGSHATRYRLADDADAEQLALPYQA